MDALTQSHQISKIILVNFQSWDSSQQEIQLVTDIVNNIQGSNETGKSVLFKVLYEMYFPGYYGAEDLIRDACQAGLLFITLTDGTQIIWECAKHYRRFYMQYPGEEICEWLQDSVPQAITDALGFVVNYDHNIILNIIDTDTPMPFVRSNPKYNAALLKSVIEPDIIKQFYEACQTQILEIATAKSRFDKAASLAYAKYTALEYEDCFLLAQRQSSIQQLAGTLQPVIAAYNSALEVYNLMLEEPQQVEDVCSIAGPYLCVANLINSRISCGAYLKSVLANKPGQLGPDPESASQYIGMLDVLAKQQQQAQTLTTILASAPKQVSPPEDVKPQLNFEGTLEEVIKSLKTIKSVKRKQALANQLVTLAGQGLKDVEKELGVCPTCGRKFNDEHNDCSRATLVG